LSKKNKPFSVQQGNQPAPKHFLTPNQAHQILGQQQSMVAVETITAHQGPIPAPEIISGYEKVLAGSADRIIKMAEMEQLHRHKLQLKRQTQIGLVTLAGQVSAFLLGCIGIVGGILLLYNNKSITGFGTFLTSFAALIGLYFYNKKPNRPSPPQE
jgi:uncharacterized membrane protein